jgi:BMFP domain-containing protein YqiC
MIKTELIDEMAERLSNTLPSGFKQFQAEMEKNFRAIMQGAFSKMDLVSREEFDVQSAVLARTRQKVEQIEKQLSALEAQLDKKE